MFEKTDDWQWTRENIPSAKTRKVHWQSDRSSVKFMNKHGQSYKTSNESDTLGFKLDNIGMIHFTIESYESL